MSRFLRRIGPALVLILFLFQGRALALTPTQLAALKTHILANTNTIDYGGFQVAINALPLGVDAALEIAKWYNLPASTDFWVWRTSVTKAEIVQRTSRTGTSFMLTGTGFITRSAGEHKAWDELFSTGPCNPSLLNVRQAFVDIFSGTGNAALNRTHLDAVSRRTVSHAEKLFATGAGTDTAANAGLLTFEGALTADDVHNARTS